MGRSALIAIGGNSLVRAGERGTIEEQQENLNRTAQSIVALVKEGWSLIITHGNGPQVGAALLRSERAESEAYSHPLDVCVATTQGEIGYLLQRALEAELYSLGIKIPVITLLTQVRVDTNDPEFQEPTKPIGPFYSWKEAERKQRALGWHMVEDAARGFRRVVPSPQPLEVMEHDSIKRIFGLGFIVIALGGGGVPVVVGNHHHVRGVEAVIDKDRASALLASSVGVQMLVMSTEVNQVYLDFKKPTQRGLETMSVRDAKTHLRDGQFPPGSMGPKIESAIRFLEAGGREVVISSPEHLVESMKGRGGTHIVP